MERLPAPVPSGRRGRCREHHERVHGPQRRSGDRQPVADHRGAAGDMGFDGFVVSDAHAVHDLRTHGFAADLTDAGARALRAGVDLEMAIDDAAYAHLPEAVEPGWSMRSRSTPSVRRMLTAKVRLGLLDEPYVDEDQAREVLADPAHREVGPRCCAAVSGAAAQRGRPAAARPNAGSIAVIGPLADSQARHPRPLGLRLRPRRDRDRPGRHPERVGDGVEVGYAPGHASGAADLPVDVRHVRQQRARRPAGLRRRGRTRSARSTWPRAADVAVVVVGEWQNMIGEAASRSTSSCRAASSSCCRPSWRPGRRSCCWS